MAQSMGGGGGGNESPNAGTGAKKEAGSKRSTWTPLAARERGAVNQKYVNQLPLEYRGVLEEYFEAISTPER